MSEYVSYQSEIVLTTARQGLAEGFSEAFRDFSSWSSSTWLSTEERETKLQKAYHDTLMSHAADLRTLHRSSAGISPSICGLEAMLQALSQTPELLAHLQIVQQQDWDSVQRDYQSLLSLSHQLNHGESEDRAGTLRERLREMVARSHKALADAEVQFTMKTMTHAMKDLGYQVEQRGQALRAVQGPTCLWAQVSPKGGVCLDMGGLSGLQCLQHFQELEQALEERGLKLRRKKTNTHGRPEGGELARKLSVSFEATHVRDPFGMEASNSSRRTKRSPAQVLRTRR